ncbi:MAG: hypothetical protein II828_09410 [Clostridia bacterium]|nr:hypothetical protein [Clostridia bacterium]
MSVIFSFALTGVGHLAHAVSLAAETLLMKKTFHSEYELSQDGETVWNGTVSYTFVGFGEDGDFSSSFGREPVSVGRRLGRLKDEPEYRVWQLKAAGGDYIMVKSKADTAEVFRRV